MSTDLKVLSAFLCLGVLSSHTPPLGCLFFHITSLSSICTHNQNWVMRVCDTHMCVRERRVWVLLVHSLPISSQKTCSKQWTHGATADLWLHWSGFKPALFESEMHSGANKTHCAQTSAWRDLGFWGGTFWNAKSWNDRCIQNCSDPMK